MAYVLIRHKVANYARWKRVVVAASAWRKASGEKSFYVLRDAKDPNDLTVCCGWDTAARMKQFVNSADLRLRMKEAGVIGQPEIRLFNKMDDLSMAKGQCS